MSNKFRLAINSRIDRQTNDSNSDFRVYLKEAISSLKSSVKIGLKKVAIPNTMYSFSEYNNVLYYVRELNTGPNLSELKFETDRIYEGGKDLENFMNNEFSNKGHNITVVFDEATQRFSFTNNESNPFYIINTFLNPTFQSVTLENSAHHKIGIIRDTTQHKVSNGSTFECKGLPKILNTSVYHIVSNKLGDTQKYKLVKSRNHPIIASVFNDVSFGDMITREYSDDETFFSVVNDEIEIIDIQILDEEYQPVNLNGSNLVLEFVYWFVPRS